MTTVTLPPEARDRFESFRRNDMRDRMAALVAAGVPLIEKTGRDEIADRDILSDLAYEIEVYLRGLGIPQLVCLAYGHRWPELVPGRGVPKGFRILPSPGRQGVSLIRERCIRRTIRSETDSTLITCGTIRQSLTLPGEIRGLFDRGHGRNYDYDNDEWAIRPAGSRLTRIDFWNEIIRRMERDLYPGEYEGTEDEVSA